MFSELSVTPLCNLPERRPLSRPHLIPRSKKLNNRRSTGNINVKKIEINIFIVGLYGTILRLPDI
jgi:hypothetical protein